MPGGGTAANGEVVFSGDAATGGYLDITAGTNAGTYTLSPGAGTNTYFNWDNLVFPTSEPFLDSTGGLLFTNGGLEINFWGNGPGSYSLLGAPPKYGPYVTNGVATIAVSSETITRTWLLTDACGNSNTCSQTVTVANNTPPVLACAGGKTVQCGTAWSFDAPTASGGCSGSNVAITVASTVTNGHCPQLITRTWLATDACGNTNTCSQTVTVVNTNPPVLTCAGNLTVSSGQAWSFTPPTASDVCCTNLTITVLNTVTNVSVSPCAISYTRTWQAMDCCSNTAACSQTVTVQCSGLAPVITEQPQSLTTTQGLTILFSVTAVGTPPLGYQWLLNGSPLLGATNDVFSATNARLAAAGLYSVAVSSAFGNVTSTAVPLDMWANFHVWVKAGTDFTNAEAQLQQQGAVISEASALFGRFTCLFDSPQSNAIAALSFVRAIEPAFQPATYNLWSRYVDNAINVQANPANVKSPPSTWKAWGLPNTFNLTGDNAHIGVWDGGWPYHHPDFASRLTFPAPPCYVGYGNDQEHPTHVIGTLAGDGSFLPSFSYAGMAPLATIEAWDNGEFCSTLPDPSSEMSAARTQSGTGIPLSGTPIDLSQNSWGYPPQPIGSLFSANTAQNLVDANCWLFGAYTALCADYDGIVRMTDLPIIFAAGNFQDGYTDGGSTKSGAVSCTTLPWTTITPIATAKNVIAVGAVDTSDLLAVFSSCGPTSDGRLKPDVMALGYQVISTIPTGYETVNYFGDLPYNSLSGTSMAAPAVSGVAALLVEEYRHTLGTANDPSAALLKAVLCNTAAEHKGINGPAPDYQYGYGVINAVAAATVIQNQQFVEFTPGLVTGGKWTQTITIPSASCTDLKVLVAWTDYEYTGDNSQSGQTTPRLLNDLDLVVTGPPGATTYYPFTLDPMNPGNPAATPKTGNHLDNVEQVLVPNAPAGTYTMTITGNNVPQGPQPFAITWWSDCPPPPPSCPPQAVMQSIKGLYNTGVDSNGNPLEPWTIADTHYSLFYSADPRMNIAVVSTTSSSSSANIEPSSVALSATTPYYPPSPSLGMFTYRLTFDLTCADPTTAKISGQWQVDDWGQISLNGAVVSGSAAIGNNEWSPFTIESEFLPGLNNLDFVTTNSCCLNTDGSYAGITSINVAMTGTACYYTSPTVALPSAYSACQGNSVTLTATVTGPGGPFTYSWVDPNNNPISGANGPTYTINSVTTAAAGSYCVTVTGIYPASVSPTCVTAVQCTTLTVLTPTTITPLASLSAFVGQSATFTTTPGGTGPFTYVWTHNGNTIAGANGPSYTIPAVTAADAGTYCVDVQGACGPAQHQCGVLEVLGKVLKMQFTNVGDPGNAPDANGFGAVANCFAISATELVNADYAQFLNSVDPTGANALELFYATGNSYFPGESGIELNSTAPNGMKYSVKYGFPNKPVALVTFFAAMRFANWMHNGGAPGGTETGAYTLNGDLLPTGGLEPRNPGAMFWIPSEDEWYKAAYYDPTKAGANKYWLYPTRSNTQPNSRNGGNDPNSANYFYNDGVSILFNGGYAVTDSTYLDPTYTQTYLTDVGAYTLATSYYGTFDQGGNVWEWTEGILIGMFGNGRALWGGSWSVDSGALQPSGHDHGVPSAAGVDVGFRLATGPVCIDPPTVTPLSDVSVCVGQSATFSTTLSGTFCSSVWTHNGTPISNAFSPTYTITNVTPADAGAYCFTVISQCGAVQQCATLTVVTPPTATAPGCANVCPGASVTLSTTAGGSGPFTYVWTQNGVKIPLANGPSYTVTVPTVGADTAAGTYCVTVAGACGSVTVCGYINVFDPPTATPLTSLTVCEGQPATFASTPGGGVNGCLTVEIPLYYWTHNGGGPIPGTQEQDTYTIASVTAADAGTYCFNVFTRCGSVQQCATLDVKASTPACNCVTPPDNMVLWLPFDETTGPISANLAVPQTYGTQSQFAPTHILGAHVANSLFFFDGQSVIVPDYPGINPGTGDLTIDAWVLDENFHPFGQPCGIVDKRDVTTGVGYSLFVSGPPGVNFLGFTMSGVTFYDQLHGVPEDRQWHFVAVSVSRSAGTPQGSFYIDGVRTSTFTPTTGNLNNMNSFLVGASPLLGNLGIGGIDEVEMYNRALTSDELFVIYKAGAAGKCKPACYLQPSDLWMKDTMLVFSPGWPEDFGSEPNGTDAPMWISSDIWVRNLQDTPTGNSDPGPDPDPTSTPSYPNSIGIYQSEFNHQNPLFGSYNYVYVKVRGGLCLASNPNEVLRVYWAKNATAMPWSLPGVTGSLWTEITPTGGWPLPVIQPGYAYVAELPWSPPDPNVPPYDGHFCLVARIERNNTPTFGMTFPEGTVLWDNVYNNNNIVQKNVTVVSDTMPGGGGTNNLIVRNTATQAQPLTLQFSVPPTEVTNNFLLHGDIVVDLGSALLSKWQQGGQPAVGFVLVSNSTQIRIADPTNAVLSGMLFNAGEEQSINVDFQRRSNDPLAAGLVFNWDITQIQPLASNAPPRVVGGERYTYVTQGNRLLWNTSGGILSLSWIGGGVLQQTDNPAGPWTDVPTTISPYSPPLTARQRFYRVVFH